MVWDSREKLVEEFLNLALVCEVKLGKSGLDISPCNSMVMFVSELGFTQNDQNILQVMVHLVAWKSLFSAPFGSMPV